MKEYDTKAMGEIDLYDYLRVMWQWKWVITIGVVVTMLAAILVSSRIRTYESEGIFRLSTENVRFSIPEYINFSASFMNPEDFASYLKTLGVVPEEDLQRVIRDIERMESLEKKIQPIYVFEEEEYRRIDPDKQYVAAMEITWKKRSPVLAQQLTTALGSFAKHSFENMLMEEYVVRKYKHAYIQVQELESKLADVRFALQQDMKKLSELKKIAQGPSREDIATSALPLRWWRFRWKLPIQTCTLRIPRDN
jgi:hypothetical protein